MKILNLQSNKRLEDISKIAELGNTLKSLTIDACGRIKDFSALSKLHKLERLYLMGTNTVPNLDFLSYMPNLTAFKLYMNVADENLENCKRISWVMIKGRRHYNYKEKDFKQVYIKSSIDDYCEY